MGPQAYRTLADAVLVTHVTFVAFVILGLVLILVGGRRGWGWVRNPWFRVMHLAAIVIVVAQAWLGVVCPLTTLEMHLRARAGEATYSGTFVGHWLQRLLYYDAPGWVFALVYTLFGIAVVVGWLRFRPHRFRSTR